MAWHDGRFIVVGGLPPGITENYICEYDEGLRFRKRHVLASGYTLMGIQSVAHTDGAWWFGCCGKPAVLLRADEQFRFAGKWEFNASVGIATASRGRFLIARNTLVKDTNNVVEIVVARFNEERGMILE